MITSLPILASAEDLLGVVGFFKTKVTGCTIEDAKAIIDKKLLDPRKISAYVTWGVLARDGEKLKLTDLGKEFSRANDNSLPELFSRILKSIDQYHCALEWLFYRKDYQQITNVEIASYWYETKKFGMEAINDNTLKDMAVCFFRICEAAKIGTLFIGRRGQSTRLDLNRDLLGQYIGNSALTSSISKANDEGEELESVDNATESVSVESQSEQVPVAPQSINVDNSKIKIFISHGKNMDLVEQIKTLIELANLEYEVVVERESAAIPIPEKVFGAMRRCNSAVICVSADENNKKEDSSYGINQNVLIEIGSAFVLYDKRVILVWDKRIEVPSNLQGLYRCEFTGDELSWGTGIKLMKALNEFKK